MQGQGAFGNDGEIQMADVSQVMRIALKLDDGVRAGATKLAAAVDQLPFIADSPEAMYRAAHPRVAVQAAFDNASAGLAELTGVPAFARADHFGRVEQGVAHLGRALDDTPAGQEIVDASWTDLIRSGADAFDDTVRRLGSPGSY